jgi:hypothetical protein
VGNPAASDSFDEALDEGHLGVQQSEPVVLLHEEERMHPRREVSAMSLRVSSLSSARQRARFGEQSDDFVRG